MEMQVKYALSGIGTNVGHQAPTALQAPPDPARHVEHGRQELGVSVLQILSRPDMTAGYHEHVSRCGRVDVVKGDNVFGFYHMVGRDIPSSD